jgi:transposase-like protein
MQTETIKCPKCGLQKTKKDFTRRDVNVSGIHPICKVCRYQQQKLNIAKKKSESWWLEF